MEATSVKTHGSFEAAKKKFNLRKLRISLKYRPEILKLLMVMRKTNMRKTVMLKKLKHELAMLKRKYCVETSDLSKEKMDCKTEVVHNIVAQEDQGTAVNSLATDTDSVDVTDVKITKAALITSSTQTVTSLKTISTQTDETDPNDSTKCPQNNECDLAKEGKDIKEEDKDTKQETKDTKQEKKDTKQGDEDRKEEPVAWDIGGGGESGKSIADQVKEVAQSAMQQSGMVYVESAGMYYDYKTGYYYNSELGLYYHPDTGCYYHYSDDKQFVFHSYPDQRAMAAKASLLAHEKRKAKRNKKEEEQASRPKRKKKSNDKKKEAAKQTTDSKNKTTDPKVDITDVEMKNVDKVSEKDGQENEKVNVGDEKENVGDEKENIAEDVVNKEDLEDGECSETGSEAEASDGEESDASTVSASDDDAVAKHHPPCMRIIVRETTLPKLKIGNLFLVTKDGGTIGREGEHHTILLKDHNVSRNHLEIRYDMERRLYLATDLGSKNGTLLNGIQMSQSLIASQPMEVIHGSMIQLGETKLLCHIHPGNDTCGHCEPGLIMETIEKEKVAYTRNCSVKKQYELELARLKNKYAPEPLMIEEGTYNDRAKARREAVGSSHHSEKTQSTDVDTCIAPENKGFKLLEKMGWSKGEGLGKESQGEIEPVPLLSNDGTAGLGTGSVGAPQPPKPKPRNKLGSNTLRLATRSKLLQPPAKAFQNPLDEDDE